MTSTGALRSWVILPDMIETPRLLLRPHRVDDLDGYAALLAEAEPATPYALPSFNREDAWARLLRFIGHRAVFNYGLFVAEERASGRIVAEVGIARFERAVDSRCEGMPEAGWRVAQRMRGSGVAKEAMTAAFAWFDAAIGAQSTFCLIHPDNGASLRLAEGLRLRELSRGSYKEQPVITLVRSWRDPMAISGTPMAITGTPINLGTITRVFGNRANVDCSPVVHEVARVASNADGHQ